MIGSSIGRRSMAKFFQTREFRDLEKEWNEILSQSGFVDIERTKNGERVLKQNSSNAYRQADEEMRSARQEYYRNIGYHIFRTHFVRCIDCRVMFGVANGLSIKEIVEELKSDQIEVHRQTVRFIVRRFEHQWGLRFWSPEARNLKVG